MDGWMDGLHIVLARPEKMEADAAVSMVAKKKARNIVFGATLLKWVATHHTQHTTIPSCDLSMRCPCTAPLAATLYAK